LIGGRGWTSNSPLSFIHVREYIKKLFENDNDTTHKSPETDKLLGNMNCAPSGYEGNPTCTATLCDDRPTSITRTITYDH
jgi:hypothetical protein